MAFVNETHMVEMTGHHGTRAEFRDSILSSNFYQSTGDDHWLGQGAYFFEEGFACCSEQQAKAWAICEAWDKELQGNKYENYTVFKVSLQVEEDYLLDLTTEAGLSFFDFGRDEVRKSCNLRKFRRSRRLDTAILDYLIDVADLPFEVIRAWFYIQLDAESRRLKISSGIPNTTVFCVRKPEKSIKLDHIEVVDEGPVAQS